jgi:hypothetical protein
MALRALEEREQDAGAVDTLLDELERQVDVARVPAVLLCNLGGGDPEPGARRRHRRPGPGLARSAPDPDHDYPQR